MQFCRQIFSGRQHLTARNRGQPGSRKANALALVIASMMTAVAITSLIYRASPKTPWRMSWDGVALLIMYGASMLLLYALN